MVDVSKLTRDTVARGGVLAVLYFDLSAPSKDGLQQLGTALVQKILDSPGVVYALGEIDEPIENEGLFSCPVEVKILTKSLASLARICGNHTPFSV
ncbi:MAG: hypothetical protein PHS02_04705, partial [Candidatus ainarchaeum sp.]|nr:hypothetical protein [Candidatus ainarchaeum sp.]